MGYSLIIHQYILDVVVSMCLLCNSFYCSILLCAILRKAGSEKLTSQGSPISYKFQIFDAAAAQRIKGSVSFMILLFLEKKSQSSPGQTFYVIGRNLVFRWVK